MKWVLSIYLSMAGLGLAAQPLAEQALGKDGQTLRQRYALMKEKSQTFNDYKVIKEYILDGFWKLSMDSLNAAQEKLELAIQEAGQLQIKLNGALAMLQQKEASMQEVEFAGNHITVLGIDFSKGFFLSAIGFLLLGFILLLGIIAGRMKIIHGLLREREGKENLISREFEEYKRKALERQMKLSRELQDERNRMAEMRTA